jgi:hypothetical protein
VLRALALEGGRVATGRDRARHDEEVHDGGAILDAARETRDEAREMMQRYLEGEEDPLDGFEFLTMAEAGEVGHWAIVEKLNEKAGDEDVRALTEWALPIQRRHFDEVLAGSLELAADEDPNEIAE